MFNKRIVFCLALVIGFGATTKLSAQCTAPTSVSGTYCSGQYAEFTVNDPSTTARYHWYEKVGNEFKDRGYGQDGNGRNYVSTGTVSGASTYYYTKETDADIGPAYRAPVGGITTVMNVAGYKMPFTSTLDFKINAVTVVVKMTSTTKKYGFQIMHKTGTTEEFSDWVTGTIADLTDNLGAESLGADLYKVEIPVTNVSVLKGMKDTLEFRSVANVGLNDAVDGVYWYGGTAYTGGTYLSTVTLANPKQTISAADRTPLIMDWKTTVLCEKIAVTSTLSTNCCTPIPSTFKVSTSSYSTFPATLTASGTVLTTGLSYFWYDENNALIGNGVDKKTQVIPKNGLYTLKVVGNANDVNKFSCVTKKNIEIDNKSIYTFKDTTICIGQPFKLNAYGAERNYVWKSDNPIANSSIVTTNAQSTSINLTTPGTYQFVVSGQVKANNIAYDGKFEKYDKRTNSNIKSYAPSFETTYGNSTSVPVGAWIVNNNEFIVDSKIVGYNTLQCTDPTYMQKTDPVSGETTSRGNVYYADASTGGSQPPYTEAFAKDQYLWQLSDQPIKPNTPYEFSMDVSNWNQSAAGAPPEIMLLVNGTAIPIYYTDGSLQSTGTPPYYKYPQNETCKWRTIIGKWTSPADATIAKITISEVTKQSTGYEFAMDDITFSSGLETQRDTVFVTIADCNTLTAKSDSASVCAGSLVNLSAKTNGFVEKWEDPAGINLGSTPSVKAYPASTTIYTVTAKFPTKSLGLNGNFEDSYNGFSSGLKMQSGAQLDNENYKIVKGNEAFWASNNNPGSLVPFTDHSGNGSMLVTRTANDHRTKVLYSQTVPTTIGKQYGVSFYLKNILADLSTSAPVDLQINIDGVPKLDVNHPLTHNWEFYSYLFSGTGAPVKIDIVGRDTYNTNLFRLLAFDDIVIAEAGLPKVANVSVTARDCFVVTAKSDNLNPCAGSAINLSAITNGFIEKWEDGSGNVLGKNPTVKAYPEANTTYKVTAKFATTNLFPNSDFSNDNAEMEVTGLTYKSGSEPSAGEYAVIFGNENWLYNTYKNGGDHTTGTGKFLLAKINANTQAVIFKKTIAVTAGQSYGVSFFIANYTLYPANDGPASLEIKINGSSLVPQKIISNASRGWIGMEYIWTAASTGNVIIELSTPSESKAKVIALDDVKIGQLGVTKVGNVSVTTKDCFKIEASKIGTCKGDSIQITATTTGLFTGWKVISGAATIKDPTSITTWVKPTINNTEIEASAQFQLGNTLFNGDFELGDVGFKSDYKQNGGLGEGFYVIGNNSNNYNNNLFVKKADHTTGSGKMFIANGATDKSQIVYKTKVKVEASKTYAFSLWIANIIESVLEPGRDPKITTKLGFVIGGTDLGEIVLPMDTAWHQFFQTFSTPANFVGDSIEISIRNNNSEGYGNDFALDDLVFAPTFTKIIKDTVTVPACIVCKPVASGALSSSKPTICAGENTSITGALPSQETNTANTFTYKWEKREGTGAYVEIPLATGKDYTTPALSQTTTFRRTAIGLLSCRDTANTTITVNPKPDITAKASAAAYCEKENISLSFTNATGNTATIASQAWSKGLTALGTAATQAINNVALTDAVAYTVIVVSDKTCKDTATITPVIQPKPDVTATVDKPAYCEKSSITLSFSNVAGNTATIASQTWSKNTTALGTASTQVLTNVSAADAVPYTVIVVSDKGCKDTATVTPTINPAPAKPAIRADAVCADVAFGGFKGSAIANHTLEWFGTDSSSVASLEPIPDKTKPSTIYYVAQKNAIGCPSAKDSVLVVFNQLPATPTITGNTAVCEGGKKIVSVTNKIGSTYAWTATGGTVTPTTGTTNSFEITAGTANVSLTVTETSAFGCKSADASATIAVDQKPSPAIVSDLAQACINDPIKATATPITVGTGSWKVESGTSTGYGLQDPTDPTSLVTKSSAPKKDDKLIATWTVKNGVCKDTSKTMTITFNTVADPSVDFSATTPVCEGATVTFNSNGHNTGISGFKYTLYNADGTVAKPAQDSPDFEFQNVTSDLAYYVALTSTSSCRTTGKDTANSKLVKVIVNPAPSQAVADPSNPNGNPKICVDNYTLKPTAPAKGSGKWSVVSLSTGNQSDIKLSADGTDTVVSGIPENADLVMRWTVSSGVCTPKYDEIKITRFGKITQPLAGLDTTICVGGNANLVAKSIANPGNSESQAWLDTNKVSLGVNRINNTGILNKAGAFTYYFQIENAQCGKNLDSMVVNVIASPISHITNPKEVISTVANNNQSDGKVTKDPTIDLEAKTTLGYKGSWALDAKGSTGIIRSGDAATSASIQIQQLEFDKPVEATWTATDNGGHCPSASSKIIVTRRNISPAKAGDNQAICFTSTSINLNGSNFLPVDEKANWKQVSGTTASFVDNGQTATFSVSDSGTYVFRYIIVSNLITGVADSSDITIHVDKATPSPVILTSTGATLVSAKEYSLVECTEKVTSLPGQLPAYGTAMWKKDVLLGGQGTLVNPNSASSEFNSLTSAGQKSVLYWWQKNGVCDADSAKLTIDKPAIISPATITLQDGTGNTLTSKDLCAGSNYVLKAGNKASSESYVWSRVNGASVNLPSDKTTQNQAITLSTSLTNADVTQIRLTIKPPLGVPCPEDTISVKLAVHTVPSGYTIDGKTALCEDESADFTLKTIASTLPITKYNWKVSTPVDGATFVSQDDNLQKATYKFEAKNNATPFTSGIVIANVANKCGNGSDANSQSVTINLRPRNFTIGLVLPTNPEICSSETGLIQYKATVNPTLPTGTTINWYWNNFKFASTSTDSTILPTRQYFNLDGTFKLQAKLENACGESKANDAAWSIEKDIKVNPSKTLGVTIAPAPTFSDSVCVVNGGTNTFMATPITNGNNLSSNRTYTFKVTDTSGISTESLGKDSIFVTRSILKDGDQVTVVLKDPNGCFDGAREALSDIPSVVNGFVFPSSTIIPSTTKACEDRDDIELKVIRTKNIKGDYNDAGVKWFRNGVFLSQYDTTKSLPIYVGTPSESGKYTVKVKASVCPTDSTSKDSLAIKVYEKPEFSFSTYPFIIIYKEGNALPMPVEYSKLPITDTATTITAKWRADNPKYDSWLLKPDSINTLIVSAKEETEFFYNLTVTTGSKDSVFCSTSNALWVINSLPLFVPNAFSPNGDGVNDKWVITGLNKYKKITIRVFNRWGNQVFLDQDGYKETWDGTINGVSLSTGTYYAIIELSGSPDGSDQTFTRSLTIVR